MDEEKLRQRLIDAIIKDSKQWGRVLTLDSGAGTYDDVNELAAYIGDSIVSELISNYSPEALQAYMLAGHDLVSLFAETAQRNLNDAAGIGLKPMVTKPPNARIESLIEGMASIAPEHIADELANVVPAEMLGMVDTIVKYNADFQKDAGLHPIIKRTWSGSYGSHDTKHTDWCKDLAGEYAYDSRMDRKVFARHKGCRCKVEYFPSKNAIGRITALAKGEVDRESVLWNTRADTLEKRLKKANKK